MEKLTLEVMRDTAQQREGKCLSGIYVNSKSVLKWQCAKGHEWEARPADIRQGSWCPYCAGKRKTIKEMQDLASKFGGVCLSKKYIDAHSKLLWECAKGHQFMAIPNSVDQGHWCSVCVGYGKTISDMKKIAAERGGKCLSTEYLRGDVKLKWQCAKGHEWDAKPMTIVRGSWCPYCTNTGKVSKKSLKEIKQLAESRGGECISKTYNYNKKLLWRCAKGHEWEAFRISVQNGSWCPYCLGRHRTVADMHKTATERGGRYLSQSYAHTQTAQWMCAEGHVWEATPMSILRGNWCPICSQGVSESICRIVLENAFGKKFPKQKPKWLTNEEGFLMELDGYCQEVGLAFEYNGKQHYIEIKHYYKKSGSLEKRKRDDERKKNLCEINKVNLIVIPYTVEHSDIAEFLFLKCQSLGYAVERKKFQWNAGQLYHSRSNKLDEYKELALSKNGECLSVKYVDSKTKLKWRCAKNHEWMAAGIMVKRGSWCPYCVGRGKTIEDMQKLALLRGGSCTSEKYVKSSIKLKWQCAKGHQWEARAIDIINGHWCAKCAHQKMSERMKKIV